jgi:hypothetical protein
MNAAASGKPGTTAPAPAAGDVAAFGGGVVNPPSKSGVVSKADLEDYRLKSGNPTATLGQYMNQQQGKTARKGGANDPAVIAARRQPVGPAVGSQAQTAGGKNELAKQNIAGLATSQVAQPPAVEPAAPAANPGTQAAGSAFNQGAQGTRAPEAPATTPSAFNQGALGTRAPDSAVAPAAPAADPTAAVNPMTGFKNSGGNAGGAGPSYAGQGGNQTTPAAAPPADATNASGYTNPGGVGNVADFGVRGTPILPYNQGSPVKGTTNVVTRSDAEIGDTNTRTGVVTPGSYDKNRAQGEKNLNALKGLFGGNKQPAAPAAAPAAATANPLRGQFAESTGIQDPVLVRMQNLAGIRR